MRTLTISLIVVLLAAAGTALWAQQATAPATATATATASASAPAATEPTPASVPATQPGIVAKVGNVDIKDSRVNFMLIARDIDPGSPRAAGMRTGVINELVAQELIRNYLTKNGFACTDDELKAKKADLAKVAAKADLTLEQVMLLKRLTDQDLRDTVALEKLVKGRVDAKVDDFIKANPDAFNGTKVQASHILIEANPTSSSAEQLAAKAKLVQIAADLKAGKIKFAEAAKKYSSCPSKEKGGDLGEFTFDKMVVPFAQKAFSMKVDQMSDVIQTQFGFHLVLLTKREAGKETLDPEEAKDRARQILTGLLQAEIFSQAANGLTVEIYEKPEPMMPMMPGMPPGM